MKIVRCENPSQLLPRWTRLWHDPFVTLPRFLEEVSFQDAQWNENPTQYEVRYEIPGLKKDEIKLSFENGLLTLKGNKRVRYEGAEKTVAIERKIAVPEGVNADAIEARYEEGVLDITLPKREEVKPKEIAIQVK
ncbi:MAG: Hsp20/alpha crystallin family protein [Verrucomicrobiota bacterium]